MIAATRTLQARVHRTGDPPKTRERPRPEPTALPTEKHRVMTKTPRPAATPVGLPRVFLMVSTSEPSDMIPTRMLMSAKTSMRIVDRAMTQIRV